MTHAQDQRQVPQSGILYQEAKLPRVLPCLHIFHFRTISRWPHLDMILHEKLSPQF